MIRRYLLVVVTSLVLLLPMASPAGAVTDGVADGGAHPYVGLVVFYNSLGDPLHRCSGTMISETVFLTAGHCTFDTASAQVWFNESVTTALGYPFTGGITGTPYTYSVFDTGFPNTGDLGYVVLDWAPGVGYASIADVGTLDSLATKRGKQEVRFTVVGYGLQEVKPTVMADRNRLQATVRLVNLRSALTDGYNIHHTQAKGTGGGTCFGDSGGPVFLKGTTVIVAVTSFGLNEYCVGAGFAYRTDTQGAHDFIFGE